MLKVSSRDPGDESVETIPDEMGSGKCQFLLVFLERRKVLGIIHKTPPNKLQSSEEALETSEMEEGELHCLHTTWTM